MSFVTQLLIIALVFVVVAWVARARLLALVVSWIATTQHGRLTVSVESLSALGEARASLVTARGAAIRRRHRRVPRLLRHGRRI